MKFLQLQLLVSWFLNAELIRKSLLLVQHAYLVIFEFFQRLLYATTCELGINILTRSMRKELQLSHLTHGDTQMLKS